MGTTDDGGGANFKKRDPEQMKIAACAYRSQGIVLFTIGTDRFLECFRGNFSRFSAKK